MGATSSIHDNSKQRKYTSAEITNNLDSMFNRNKNNNVMSDVTDRDIQYTDVQQKQDNIIQQQQEVQQKRDNLVGGRQRYLKYEMSNLRGGSNDDYKELSDISEFEKIRQHLIKETQMPVKQNTQAGGNDQFESLMNALSSNNAPANKLNFMDALRAGKQRGGNDDDVDDDIEEDIDESSDTEEEGDELDESSSSTKPEDDKKDKKNKDKDNKEAVQDAGYSQTSQSVNIIPFYSSDSANQNHPYTKSRFH